MSAWTFHKRVSQVAVLTADGAEVPLSGVHAPTYAQPSRFRTGARMTVSRFVSMVRLDLLTAPLAAEAQQVARVPFFGAIEDTQTRSHRGMLR
jgi:hypothetical protein